MMTRFLCRIAELRRKTSRAIGARVLRFGEQEDGAIALMFGIALVLLILTVGTAIDFGYATMAKTKLNAAADAAVLAAVDNSGLSSSAEDATEAVLTTFKAQNALPSVTMGDIAADVSDDAATGRTAVISYAATVPTAFMGMVGIKSMDVKGTSTAVSPLPNYVDFYLLLDNTPSMGVGATTADIDKLLANTPLAPDTEKCAFACHDLSRGTNDYYGLAKRIGAQMRIDVMRTATQQLMDTAESTQTVKDQYRTAIYTFGASCPSVGVSRITSVTPDLAKAKSAAKVIDLMTIEKQGYYNDQCTNSDRTLSAIDKEMPAPGDGSERSKPQKILFLVTDGVADANNPGSCSEPLTGGTRCQEPMDVSFCQAIKDRGIKIAVLYTTYLPLPTNDWYNKWLAPFQSQIGPNMEKCATPGLFFEVSPTQGIPEAMTALFKRTVAYARLTK